ncbi:MAG: DUF2937 family protein [Pseudoruegeria sp.]
MIIRTLALAGGICVGVGASQFPEYSQQYLQRLSGATEALGVVVADFDASAAAEGLSRDSALDAMVGNDFLERRQEDMRRAFARYHQLSFYLSDLRNSTALDRALSAHRFTDAELSRDTWNDFQPAVPVTIEGAGFAAGGFFVGYVLISLLFGGLWWGLRRSRA